MTENNEGRATGPTDGTDLCRILSTAPGLTARQRSDWRSAIKTISRILSGLPQRAHRRDVDAAVAVLDCSDVDALDRRLTTMTAAGSGLSERSLGHAVSRFRAALRHVGIRIRDGRGHDVLHAQWDCALDGMSADEYERVLSFARFASARERLQGTIDDALVAAFYANLAGRCATRGTDARVRALTRQLNAWRRREGHPEIQCPVPRARRDRLRPDVALLQHQFVTEIADAARLIAARREPWIRGRAGRVRVIKEEIQRIIGAGCRETGRDPATIASLEDICEPHFLDQACRHVVRRWEQRIANPDSAGPSGVRPDCSQSAYHMVCAAHSVAFHVLKWNATQMAPLDELREKHTTPQRQSLQSGHLTTLYVGTDLDQARSLLALPAQVFAQTESTARELAGHRQRSAALFMELALRYHLAPAQVVACRLTDRCDNSDPDAPTIETHTWRMRVPRSQYGAAREFTLGPGTSRLIEAYITNGIAPAAGDGGPRHLLLDRDGRGLTSRCLAPLVSELTLGEIGRRLRPLHVRSLGLQILASHTGLTVSGLRAALGRGYRSVDPLLDAIMAVPRQRRSDARIIDNDREDPHVT